MFTSIESVLKNQFGATFTIKQHSPLYGGDINQVHKLLTSEGTFVVKINRSGLPNLFETEAKGIELLKRNSGFHVPSVVSVDTCKDGDFLLMEYISSGRKTPNYWEDFGRELALMHKQSNAFFGLDHDNFIGSLSQSNTPHQKWSSFYFHERILKQLDLLGDQLSCSRQQLDALLFSIESLFSDEAPSLLHGDLWSGNCLVDEKNKPVLIDPAVYYGHREMDLAMTLLFGGFDERFYSSYHEVFPLESNWRSRVEMCQLYPLLVHANLFGGHYVNSCRTIIGKYV